MHSRCECGHCNLEHLQKASECVCCVEVEKCQAALSSEQVLEDTVEPPACITDHPGFRSVCLDKWSLRVSAEKYRRRDRSKYKQLDSEER